MSRNDRAACTARTTASGHRPRSVHTRRPGPRTPVSGTGGADTPLTSVRAAGAGAPGDCSVSSALSACRSGPEAAAVTGRSGQSVGTGSCAALTGAAHNPVARPGPLPARKRPPLARSLRRDSLIVTPCLRSDVPGCLRSPRCPPTAGGITCRTDTPPVGIPHLRTYRPVLREQRRLANFRMVRARGLRPGRRQLQPGYAQPERGLGLRAVLDAPVLTYVVRVAARRAQRRLVLVEPHQPEGLVLGYPREHVEDVGVLVGVARHGGLGQQDRLPGEGLHLLDGRDENAAEGVGRIGVVAVDPDPADVPVARPPGQDRPGAALVGLDGPQP